MPKTQEDQLLKLSADPETRRGYELRAKALSDERSRMEDAREEGMEKGIHQGIQQGIQQGMQQGKEQGIIEVVKRLLETGMPLQEAAKYTPYSAEELAVKLQRKE